MAADRIRVERKDDKRLFIQEEVAGHKFGSNYRFDQGDDLALLQFRWPGIFTLPILPRFELGQTVAFEREEAQAAPQGTFETFHRWVRVESEEEEKPMKMVCGICGKEIEGVSCQSCEAKRVAQMQEKLEPKPSGEWTARLLDDRGVVAWRVPGRKHIFRPFEFSDLFGLDPSTLPEGEEVVLRRRQWDGYAPDKYGGQSWKHNIYWERVYETKKPKPDWEPTEEQGLAYALARHGTIHPSGQSQMYDLNALKAAHKVFSDAGMFVQDRTEEATGG